MQRTLHRFARDVYACFDRADGNIQVLRNLMVFIPFVVHAKGYAVLVGKFIHRPFDIFHHKFPLSVVARGAMGEVGTRYLFRLGYKGAGFDEAPVIIDKGILHDGVQPALKVSAFLEFSEVGNRF